MADEEKPAVDEESNQAADTPTSDANDIVETAEPDASAESDAQEAIDEESDQTVDTPTSDATTLSKQQSQTASGKRWARGNRNNGKKCSGARGRDRRCAGQCQFARCFSECG